MILTVSLRSETCGGCIRKLSCASRAGRGAWRKCTGSRPVTDLTLEQIIAEIRSTLARFPTYAGTMLRTDKLNTILSAAERSVKLEEALEYLCLDKNIAVKLAL